MSYKDIKFYSGNSNLYDHCLKTDREFIRLIYICGNPRKYVCHFVFNHFFMRCSGFVLKNKPNRNKAMVTFVQFM